MKTQQGGPVRSRKGRGKNDSPYIEERTRSSNKNARRGATRGFLVTDLVILNRSQVTKTTPKQAHFCPNFHTTPTEGCLSFNRFNVHRSLHGGFSVAQGSNS
ncbi:hypothetical protein TNCV_3017571 [Trichonephila clavipes]|nr:hypothetical protein TNCV_3017571 [Trichonephila clavipes]